MYTDLFLALLNRSNARGHPILSAMLYTFCPAAARWWLAGADPTPPFDPLWQSLQDLTSGGTLLDHLARYGFENVIEDVREYVRKVEEYHKQNPVPAPELLPLFRGGKIDMARRFGSQHAINNLGGDWRNLFIYVRAWAFLSQDWRIGMKIERDSEYILSCEKVLLVLPFARLPVQFDVLVWKVPVGHVMENKIGLLVSRMEHDQLRFALMQRCNSSSKQPWPNIPTVFALDRETGEVQHYDQTLADKDLERIVQSLSDLAKNGPHPPLNALRQPSLCKHCGYQSLCFEKNILSPHALSTL
ncbi:MAG: hypothetical protein HYR93_11265 [Chloroflexi bacterium]|nr:hypothetical protein [Chloroflexota bacterium]